MIDDESLLSDSYCDRSNEKILMGSISHVFGVTVKHLNSQYDYYKLEVANDELILLQVRTIDSKISIRLDLSLYIIIINIYLCV